MEINDNPTIAEIRKLFKETINNELNCADWQYIDNQKPDAKLSDQPRLLQMKILTELKRLKT